MSAAPSMSMRVTQVIVTDEHGVQHIWDGIAGYATIRGGQPRLYVSLLLPVTGQGAGS